jgi:hypothetical protein
LHGAAGHVAHTCLLVLSAAGFRLPYADHDQAGPRCR